MPLRSLFLSAALVLFAVGCGRQESFSVQKNDKKTATPVSKDAAKKQAKDLLEGQPPEPIDAEAKQEATEPQPPNESPIPGDEEANVPPAPMPMEEILEPFENPFPGK